VEQLDALSELFDEALAHCLPESVLVIGVAGGNGLDRIDSSVTRRVVGIDINPAYLAAVRERYGTCRDWS
jgi:spermidine synthase